ncbi:hypothetical protein [Saccharothrix coeruleofusca]|uniref:Uncharacterized protein n=1 Tax=Saccharothrix coeruleofusca TaxID=33919 RepID=A0A918ECV2_9PSEU|nr:hypothetical protein [Saccharothrix coeruleofusca]MBP2336591.1 hypothetical protein [Saccharothrix coeruleofusca]GGP51922.1 hypothetical protein GCM10010185_24970 [Saccharothrix coeruleofusca]
MRLLLWITLLCVSVVGGAWILPVLAGLLIAFCSHKSSRVRRGRRAVRDLRPTSAIATPRPHR